MDEIQIIEDAQEVLRQIMQEYPHDEVSLLAGSMTLAVRPNILDIETKSFPADREAELLKASPSA